MSIKTLVLLTRPLATVPEELSCMVMGGADKVVLLQDGVYNKPGEKNQDKVYGMPGGHRGMQAPSEEVETTWPEKWAALGEDVSARRIEVGCEQIDYAALVELIENHEKIITL